MKQLLGDAIRNISSVILGNFCSDTCFPKMIKLQQHKENSNSKRQTSFINRQKTNYNSIPKGNKVAIGQDKAVSIRLFREAINMTINYTIIERHLPC